MSRPVSEILLETYGIHVEPGKKTVCPECKHRTLSLKRDDTLAKCFHPECGKWIAAWSKGDKESPMSILLMTLYNDFHKALLEKKTSESQNAYKYLTEERRVHEKVIEHSLIGVVPKGYRINDKIKKLSEPQSRDYTDDGPDDQPLESITNLKETIKKSRGWIAFFYTDEYHRMTSVKFRRPYSKDFMMFKPINGKTGVFGYGLFAAGDHGEKPNLDKELMVVEGEFNQLQLQSLMARHNECRGSLPEHGYVNAVAVGGVAGADMETISRISRKPYIFYDNDSTGGGFHIVKRAQDYLSPFAVTTPGTDSDVDSYIRSFGNDQNEAVEAVKSIIGEGKRYYRNIETTCSVIGRIRIKDRPYENLKSHERNRLVADHVIQDLLDRGKFYKDQNDLYYFSKESKILCTLAPKGEDIKLLLSGYNLNPTEDVFKFVAEELCILASKEGKDTDVFQYCYYNQGTYTFYLYNGNNQILKITEDDICHVDNGTDGVLFLDDRNYEPFELTDIDPTESMLDKQLLSKIVFAEDRLTVTQRKLALCIWLYSIFFESIMPTKPILGFIGDKGSGKSSTAKLILRIIFGRKYQLVQPPDKPTDFNTIVTNSYLVAIDNADSNTQWLPDKLAVAATGGSVQIRKLYLDNRLLTYPIKCFLIITSRSPYFNRDDIADRMIIMKLDRIIEVRGSEEREHDLLQGIDNNRDRIMSEIVHNIQEIIGILKAEAGIKHQIRFRMADYADFMLRIANQAGIKPIAEDIIEQMGKIQSDFTLEDDILPELIENLLDSDPDACEEISTSELYEKLKGITSEKEYDFPFKNVLGFGKKMKQIRHNLAENLDIICKKGRGNRTFWTLRRRNEA